MQPTYPDKRQEQPRFYWHGPPQIIVKYGERKVAFGRHTVADMGRRVSAYGVQIFNCPGNGTPY